MQAANKTSMQGRGRNANVYECHAEDGQRYAMKLYAENRRSEDDVKQEIRILKHLREHPNIITFIDSVRAVGALGRGIVLECIDHTDFRSLFPRFDSHDVQFYMNELAKALEFAHGCGVMHRDVRPHNVVINHESRQVSDPPTKGLVQCSHVKLRLIGWGSSDFYHPDTDYTPRVGTFKPPELLLSVERYDYQVDIWGFGAMLASMVFRKEPFFHGISNADQLSKIARVLGSDGLYAYCLNNAIELEEEEVNAVGQHPQQPLSSLITPENSHLVSNEALDLVSKLLQWDPKVDIRSRRI